MPDQSLLHDVETALADLLEEIRDIRSGGGMAVMRPTTMQRYERGEIVLARLRRVLAHFPDA